MSAAALSPTRQFAVPASLDSVLAGNGPARSAAAGKAAGNAIGPANTANSNNTTDQVTLSDHGKAAALDELTKDAAILGKLTRQSLSSLTPDAGSAQITFDHLTYSKSSSFSLQQNGNSGSFHSEQQQSISGTGHIKTADGREFEFSAELDVSQSLDVQQSGPGGFDLGALAEQALGAAQNASGFEPRPNGPRNTGIVPPDLAPAKDQFVKLNLPKLQDLAAAGDQLLDLLKQLNPLNQLNQPNPARQDPASNQLNQIKQLIAQPAAPAANGAITAAA
jgi:hypothetical protein